MNVLQSWSKVYGTPWKFAMFSSSPPVRWWKRLFSTKLGSPPSPLPPPPSPLYNVASRGTLWAHWSNIVWGGGGREEWWKCQKRPSVPWLLTRIVERSLWPSHQNPPPPPAPSTIIPPITSVRRRCRSNNSWPAEGCRVLNRTLFCQGMKALMNSALDPLLDAMTAELENHILKMHLEDFGRWQLTTNYLSTYPLPTCLYLSTYLPTYLPPTTLPPFPVFHLSPVIPPPFLFLSFSLLTPTFHLVHCDD